jgi:cytochrome b561
MPDTEVKMPKGYSSAQIALHWIIALLIALQFLFNEPMVEAFDSALEGELQPFSWTVWAHIAGGIAILALALWRVALRRSRGVPPPPEGEGTLLGRAASLGHWALYALILVLPVVGLIAWFGGVELAGDAHGLLSNLLLFVVAVHVAAALWHQFWLKDHLLRRMMRAER